MFTTPCVLHDTCCVPNGTCQVSGVTRQVSHVTSCSQTVRARELTFWGNVHPLPCVTCLVSHVRCHMSGVRYHVSGVRCHMSGVMCHFFSFSFFIGQIGGAIRWRVCYQQGLSCPSPRKPLGAWEQTICSCKSLENPWIAACWKFNASVNCVWI